MPTIAIPCPDSVLISLKETPEKFAREATKLLAVKLYEMGKLSSGRAAELAGMSRVSFLQSLGKYGAPIFDLTKEELQRDLQNACPVRPVGRNYRTGVKCGAI